MPHVTRALRLHRVVAKQRTADEAAQAAFDRWGHAAFVLDGEARVVVMNRAADRLLHRADGLYLGRDGQLRALGEPRTRALDATLRTCAAMINGVDAGAHPAQLDGIILPGPSGGSPLRAMISPLPFLTSAATAEFTGGSVLLIIFDPEHSPPTPFGWIARQFNLTPAEQRLTEAIVSGLPLAQAAEQLGIRINTARTRLKTIQAKTHRHRQVDLVRLAMSLPAVRQD